MKEEKELELIPYCRPYPWSLEDRKKILRMIDGRLTEGRLTKGDYAKDLEEEVKKIYKVKYCIATSSCTMGLYLCHKVYDILLPLHIPDFNWPSFYNLLDKHVMIEIHDINPKTWLMENTFYGGVVIPVHTFGNIIEIKRRDNIVVIYDGAHAFLSKIKDFGNATVFSLAATKIITSGDGGLVLTNNKEIEKEVRKKAEESARMSELHAAVGLITLQYRNEIIEWKKEVFEYYSTNIPGIFQEIPIASNYNTIGFLNNKNLYIPTNKFEYKQYYKPISKINYLPISQFIYENIIVLPSFYQVDYKKITKEIWKLNDIK